jgi:hypothetical protein
VVINEVMADNNAAVDNGATFPDYIELKNVSGATVNLLNYRLSDNTNDTFKFRFLNPRNLAPGERLVVYADSATNEPGIHTGFGLGFRASLVFVQQPVWRVRSLPRHRQPLGLRPDQDRFRPLETAARRRSGQWTARRLNRARSRKGGQTVADPDQQAV